MKKRVSSVQTLIGYVIRKLGLVRKTTLISYILFSLMASVFPVLIALQEKGIIDFLTGCSTGIEGDVSSFYACCAVLGGLMLMMAVCENGRTYINNVFSLRYKKKFMLENVDRFTSLKMEIMENYGAHYLFDMACNDTNINPFDAVQPAMTIVTVIVTVISYAVVLIQFNIIAAVLPFVLAIPLLMLGQKKGIYEFQAKYDGEIMELSRRVSYFTSIIKEPLYAKENTVYNIGNFFLKKRKESKNAMMSCKMGYLRKSVEFTVFIAFLTLVSQYIFYAVLGIKVLNGKITLGSLNLYFNAFTTIMLSVNGINDNCQYLQAQVKLDKSKQQFMDLPLAGKGKKVQEKIVKGKHNIVFEHVSFSYMESERMIIDDLSFKINKNDTVALIGENGSGKSTLIKLLLGQYEPKKGRILIDGIDIRDYSPEDLASVYGAMFQNVAHFAVPVREYVTLSEKNSGNERFINAVRNADCSDIISNAPAGVYTIMGGGLNRENAKDFSGGEWQRMAIARLYYADPDIFVMDEPTAALDAEAEYTFFKKIKKIAKDHQVVIVSHRLSIARLCSKIVFFNEGMIMVDSHDNLLQRSDSYRQLYEMQKNMYFPESVKQKNVRKDAAVV